MSKKKTDLKKKRPTASSERRQLRQKKRSHHKAFQHQSQRCKISSRNPKKNADDPRQLPKRNPPRSPRDVLAKSRSRR